MAKRLISPSSPVAADLESDASSPMEVFEIEFLEQDLSEQESLYTSCDVSGEESLNTCVGHLVKKRPASVRSYAHGESLGCMASPEMVLGEDNHSCSQSHSNSNFAAGMSVACQPCSSTDSSYRHLTAISSPMDCPTGPSEDLVEPFSFQPCTPPHSALAPRGFSPELISSPDPISSPLDPSFSPTGILQDPQCSQGHSTLHQLSQPWQEPPSLSIISPSELADFASPEAPLSLSSSPLQLHLSPSPPVSASATPPNVSGGSHSPFPSGGSFSCTLLSIRVAPPPVSGITSTPIMPQGANSLLRISSSSTTV